MLLYCFQFQSDDTSGEVETGDAILVPSNAMLGINNIGRQNLVYLTANG
jgi:mannose-6-phosphate isomerase-like protein (cupin superfamily)